MNSAEQHKQQVTDIFNLVADGYGSPALRFFPFCADQMVYQLRPRPGSKILDVATGQGAVAIAAAQMVGPQGRVAAIDLAENMLDWVERRALKQKLGNIDLHVMDAEKLEFRSQYFDAVLCSFGLFFLPDMEAALRSWLRVTRPGGTIMFSAFANGLMEPMSGMFRERIQRYGVSVNTEAWQRLRDEDEIRLLLENAGATQVEIVDRQFGIHLNSADDWWEVVWNSGYRGMVAQLDPASLEQFKLEHLAEVADLKGEKGVWMDVPVHIVSARRPEDGQ